MPEAHGHPAQSAAAVLMVRPACFGFNSQTAESNAFQRTEGDAALGSEAGQATALLEFDAVSAALRAAGIKVLIGADTPSPVKPDAIFPNNWVSFHDDGTVALYPMLAANRRLERREELLEQVVREGGYRVSRTVDFTYHEAEGKYLEGTGSLVLDRVHRVAYACSSPRTDLDVLGDFAQQLDYELVNFDALDSEGRPIYHTNVVMTVGSSFAIICGESLQASHRAAVFARLQSSGHDIIDIGRAQMLKFAGNALELAPAGGRILVLSNTALGSLTLKQRAQLEQHARLVPVDIPYIERVGGGGVRCMLAEIHLPAS
jgi:hypothetical protein